MLVGTDHAPAAEVDAGWEDLDMSTATPLGDEAEFSKILDEMVTDVAPRMFAVVQVCGERVDGRIAAWGMVLDSHTEVISVVDSRRAQLRSPDAAASVFGDDGDDVTARVVWVNPEPVGPRDDEDAAA